MQNKRIENQPDKTKYADNYTRQSTTLMNDVMKRPTTWMGIPTYPINRKHIELTRMQDNIDGITKSLVKFAENDEFNYYYESLGKHKIR